MFTDEEIHIIESTCAPGSTSHRLCITAKRIIQERDALTRRLEEVAVPVVASLPEPARLAWLKRAWDWMVKE